MVKIKTPDGVEHNVNEIDFETIKEPWCEYRLSDGTLIKFRATVVSIGKSDKYNPKGEPVYLVNSQNQMRPYVPNKLIKETEIEKKGEEESPKGYV